jgi:hypothetical protein
MNRQESERNKDERHFPSSELNPLFEFLTEIGTLTDVEDERI